MKKLRHAVFLFLIILFLTGCNTDTEKRSSTSSAISETETCVQNTVSENDVDYDLTKMNSDMVYATVYQMMMDPENYIGKTFRIEGLYTSTYYDTTGQYYHYCIIQDATACCSQGLEFVWGDGSHTDPAEYPAENTNIIVEGTFETYTEEGDSNLYCHLSNATLEMR